ncbi:MAG: macro domain-containing protein, partial [Alkalibacterium sp.]
GFELPADHVIHTVGPVYRDGKHGEANKLRDCYKNSLEVAKEKGIKTLAFPAISTGIYGYPLEEASEIATQTVIEETKDDPSIEKVIFVAFDDKTENLLKKALEKNSQEVDK